MPCTEHCGSNLGEDMRSSQDGSKLKDMKAVSFSRNRLMSKLNGHIAEAVDEFKVSVFKKMDFLKNGNKIKNGSFIHSKKVLERMGSKNVQKVFANCSSSTAHSPGSKNHDN